MGGCGRWEKDVVGGGECDRWVEFGRLLLSSCRYVFRRIERKGWVGVVYGRVTVTQGEWPSEFLVGVFSYVISHVGVWSGYCWTSCLVARTL